MKLCPFISGTVFLCSRAEHDESLVKKLTVLRRNFTSLARGFVMIVAGLMQVKSIGKCAFLSAR